MAATPEPFPGFTAEQTPKISRVSQMLMILGPLLLLAAAVRVAFGVVDVWKASWGGLLVLPEGLLLGFAGLALIIGAADAGYLRDVKGREKEHLSNTYRSINDSFTALLILGSYLAFIHLVSLIVRLAS